MAVPSRNNGENELPCEMDTFDNAVHEFSSIQDHAQWNGVRSYLTTKRAQASDPLFPYLFILCADELSSSLRDLIRVKRLLYTVAA